MSIADPSSFHLDTPFKTQIMLSLHIITAIVLVPEVHPVVPTEYPKQGLYE